VEAKRTQIVQQNEKKQTEEKIKREQEEVGKKGKENRPLSKYKEKK
jgi:hypothetical protein